MCYSGDALEGAARFVSCVVPAARQAAVLEDQETSSDSETVAAAAVVEVEADKPERERHAQVLRQHL